jgi:uncharacterized protein
MRVIDAHVHAWNKGDFGPRHFDEVAEAWARRGPGRDPRVIKDRIEGGLIDPDGSGMIEAMDLAGVDVAVLLQTDRYGPEGRSADEQRRAIEHTAGLVDTYPGRFLFFAGGDPDRPEAAEILEWAITEKGARGLKLLPRGWHPYEQKAFPLYEVCQSRGVPVLFHTGENVGSTPARFSNPLYLQDVQNSFPELHILAGHAGARLWWEEAVAAAKSGNNTYLELSCWIWPDRTTPIWLPPNDEDSERLTRRLVHARDRLGPEKLVFGTDHVSGPRVRGPGFMVECVEWYRSLPERAKKVGSSFSDEEMHLLMSGNIARILGLDDTAAA